MSHVLEADHVMLLNVMFQQIQARAMAILWMTLCAAFMVTVVMSKPVSDYHYTITIRQNREDL